MAIGLKWLDGRQAIYWTFEPDWTIEEFYRAFEQCFLMANGRPFYVVADMKHVYSMPSDSLSIFIMLHATLPENYMGTLVINASNYVSRLFTLMNRQPFTRDRFRMVDSLDEARQIIRREPCCA